ncbi:MAG: thiamine-phosphate kinase [Leptolyngbyaceae bacterium]|nr:thiamine-phosphate kinase [Leptolyngbyaceae bacterium]
MRICDLGEQRILQRLQRFCPDGLVGDDAALMAVAPDHRLVVTADTMVDGVHFSWGMANPAVWTMTPRDAGWRVAAANLSDIAAMGAQPLGITVSLGLPPQSLWADIEALYQGMVDCLAPHHTPIVGGDVCRSSVLTVAIAAFGQVLPHQAIPRSQAQPGDAILVTGYHGNSRAGLELLLQPHLQGEVEAGDRQALIQSHQRPHPRLDVIHQLRQLELAQGQSVRVAGMDSSDGLADALWQICRASQVGAVVDRTAIPIAPALKRWRSPQDALNWALYGGEDFELVLTCEGAIAHALIAQIGFPAAIIGHITAPPDIVLTDPDQPNYRESLQLTQSFQHF